MKNHKKIALITGASSGLGNAISKKLISNNYYIYGVSRTEPKNLNKNQFTWIKLDLSKKLNINQLNKTFKQIKELNIIINCAGKGQHCKFPNIKEKDIFEIININLISPILITKSLLPKTKNNGQVIFISSTATLFPSPMASIYTGTKSFLENITDTLNLENKNIQFKILRPGIIKSNFHKNIGINIDKAFIKFYQSPEKAANNLYRLLNSKYKEKNSGIASLLSFSKNNFPTFLNFTAKLIYNYNNKKI